MSDRNWYRANIWGRESVAIALALVLLILAIITSACQVMPNDQSSSSEVPNDSLEKTVVPTDFPADFPTPDPEELAACHAEGGRWEVLGFSGPGCNLPTGDGGQPCTDSEQCESDCLGDPEEVMIGVGNGRYIPDHDRIAELNSQEGDRVGMCSPWVGNFGCWTFVQNGKYAAICVD